MSDLPPINLDAREQPLSETAEFLRQPRLRHRRYGRCPDPTCVRRRVRHENSVVLSFQNGPINEVGVNGITQEVLLAVVADRLRSFQAGPFACRENALALTKVEEAMHWLQKRTMDRMRRGVEGKSVK
jgi:hypothetical protein